jgi:serine/threonine-protein kinase HipA
VNLTTSVENEWLCLNILQAYGLPAANCQILDFDGQRVLGVERFDRRMHSSGKWLMRLPQEDFCQALGLPPHLKYESDGGPGVRDIAQILRQSENSKPDLETLLAAQVLFWLLAAPDGHAKNFSIQLLAGGRYRLAPLYDVVSIWPMEGAGPNQWSWHKAKLAMAMVGKNRHYLFKEIQRRHFDAMAARCGYGRDAEPIIGRIVERTDAVIGQVSSRLPAGFTQQVADSIFAGLKATVVKLQSVTC